MKLYLPFILYACLVIFIPNPILFTFAETDNEKNETFINSYDADLTGDGFQEHFTLRGVLLSNRSHFYRDVWMDISSPFSHQWKISFDGGYDPDIQLIDLNHDHIFDIFYQVAKDENKRQYNYQLYTLQNGMVKNLPLPKHKHIQGKFLNGFKIKIQINPHKAPIIKDIKEEYTKQNIYKEDGTLVKDKKLNITPISFLEPILISETKGYGLKSYQSIKGINEKDVLGEIITLWYYKDDEWIILTSEWKANS